MRKRGSFVPDFVRKNIAQLRTERKKRGYTLRRLRFLTGIHETMISNYEKGKFMPQEANYNALAKVFGWRIWDSLEDKRHALCLCFFEQEYINAQEKAKLYGLSLSGLIRKLLAELPLQKP